MILTIDGNTYTAKILPDFQPSIDMAVRWTRASNGKLLRRDRGIESDVHSSSVVFAGANSDIQDLYALLTDPAFDFDIVVQFEDGENIFGPSTAANIAIDSLTTIVFSNISELRQRTLTTSGFSAEILLAGEMNYLDTPALPATFYPTSASTISASNYLSNKPFYDVAGSGFDRIKHTADSASIRFECVMQQDDAAGFQAWWESSNRGAKLTNAGPDFILSGINKPFGDSYAYPCAVHFREVSFVPMGPQYWRVSVTLERAK